MIVRIASHICAGRSKSCVARAVAAMMPVPVSTSGGGSNEPSWSTSNNRSTVARGEPGSSRSV